MALPPVVKNLILINVVMLIADFTAKSVFGVDLTTILGLYFPKSDQFMPLQIITHMFMHANFMHLFFNMFALYMFGGILENVWGPKRFLIYYMVCGLGAALVHETVIMFQYNKLINAISPDNLQLVIDNGAAVLNEGKQYADVTMRDLQMLLNVPTVGASGAIFGVLLAFGVLFPKYPADAAVPSHPDQGQIFCYRLRGN